MKATIQEMERFRLTPFTKENKAEVGGSSFHRGGFYTVS